MKLTRELHPGNSQMKPTRALLEAEVSNVTDVNYGWNLRKEYVSSLRLAHCKISTIL